MRKITGHEINPCNEAISIECDDRNPENGNASHHYAMRYMSGGVEVSQELHFQDGPIGAVGVNGITQEALLAILIDRLRGFQSSKFACRENALALTKLEEAKHWLLERTRGRMERGVEGTQTE